MPAPQATAAAETKSFTVANGRTVSHQPAPNEDTVHYGPGETIDLPVKEGERLQKLGFLRFDDGTSLVPSGGPATEGGVEIKEIGE